VERFDGSPFVYNGIDGKCEHKEYSR